jgi:hypothetical protein
MVFLETPDDFLTGTSLTGLCHGLEAHDVSLKKAEKFEELYNFFECLLTMTLQSTSPISISRFKEIQTPH